MAKKELKELTTLEHNDAIWAKVKKLESEVAELKVELKPAELPKQASLNDCNILARKVKRTPAKVNPKLVAEERV